MDINVPEGYFFTREHEWVKVKGDTAKIGISDYAQQKLGDITYVDLPGIGKEVDQSEVIAGIESVKAASDIYSPVSGKVTAVNEDLEEKPELINESPYEKGWIAEMGINSKEELDSLMDAAAYLKYTEGLE